MLAGEARGEARLGRTVVVGMKARPIRGPMSLPRSASARGGVMSSLDSV